MALEEDLHSVLGVQFALSAKVCEQLTSRDVLHQKVEIPGVLRKSFETNLNTKESVSGMIRTGGWLGSQSSYLMQEINLRDRDDQYRPE